MNKAVILVFCGVVLGSIGQICIKTAMLRVGPLAFGAPSEILNSSLQVIQQPLIWVSIPLYGTGFLIWAIALSHLRLSFAYPLLAIGYVINPLSGMIFFSESIPLARWIGILIIVAGLVLVGRSYSF